MRKSTIALLLFAITAVFLINGSDVQTGNYNFDFRACSLNSEPLYFSQSNQILKSDNSSENINLYLSKGECLIQSNSKILGNCTYYLNDFNLVSKSKTFKLKPLSKSFYKSTSTRAPPLIC